MAVEGENLGIATIYVAVDTTNMEAGIAKSKLALAGLGPEAQKQYDTATAGQRKLIDAQLKQIALIGKTAAERAALNAQLKIGGALGSEMAALARSNAQAVAAAQKEEADSIQNIVAAEAEARAAQQARYDAVMAHERELAAMYQAEADAKRAATASMDESAVANSATSGAGALSSSELVAAQNARMARSSQVVAAEAAIDDIMSRSKMTIAEVTAAEDALDEIRSKDLLTVAATDAAVRHLAEVRLLDTEGLQANSAAQVENAAATSINSRTQYELGIMLGEVASGNINRLKRSTAALANSTGLLRAIMTPVGLAITGIIATLALFGKAVYDREQDLEAFNKALAETGDVAGTTGLQLQDVATVVGQATHDYSDSTKAVLALAKSGEVLGSSLQDMATTAVNMAYLTGESVDKVVKDLIALQGDPVKAIAKATSMMGLLTKAQFDQIAETQQQQGATAAAALAMKDLSTASDAARQKLVDNAGVVIRAWDGFKGILAGIGNEIASIGAQQSLAQQIAQMQMQLTSDFAYANANTTDPNKDQSVINDRAKIASLQQQQRTQAMFAAGQELANQAKQKHDQALTEALSAAKSGTEGFIQQAAAINKKRYEALAGIVNPAVIKQVNDAYDQQIRDAVKRLNSQYGHVSTGHHRDPAATALATFQSQVNGLTNRSIGVDGDAALTKYVQGVAKLNDEFDKAIAKHVSLTQAQAVYDDGMKALNATLAKNQAAQEADQKALRDASDAKVAAYKAQIALQVEAVGMGDKEIQRAQQLAQLRSQYADQIERLEERKARHPDQANAIDQQIANTKREMDAMVQATKQGYAAMDAAQANWENGAERAIKNFKDQTADVATQTAGIFNTAFSDMTNALVTFVETGKLSFKSLVTDVLKGIAEMEIKAAESKLFGYVGQLISSYFGGGTTIDSNAIASGNYTGPHAMGGVFPGPIAAFAGGGIVNSPTLFKFANGTGLMGEAGPEAIMPLSRGRDGKLGVKAAGGGNVININTNVVVDQNGARSTTSSDSSDSAARQLGAMMEAKAKEVVSRAVQPGGLLWRHGVGQAA